LKFPKAKDYNKPNQRYVPNCLGIVYVFVCVIYLFTLHYYDYRGALPLASVILLGGFLGLLDDLIDLPWRYKSLLPIIASVPLIVLREGTTTMATYIFAEKVDFGVAYFFLIVPTVVTVTTNTVNQLGGLNGLETLCPLIILFGYLAIFPSNPLFYGPILVLAVLSYFNFKGKIFVGNVGTFAEGITLASLAIIVNMEQFLAVSILPYIVNSILKLNYVIFGREAHVTLTANGKLTANHRRSLQTLLAYNRTLTEKRLVSIICLLFTVFTSLGVILSLVIVAV